MQIPHNSDQLFRLPGLCQPVLDGLKASQLKIITIDKNGTLFNPVKMLKG